MAFEELLRQAGDFGKFHMLQLAFTFISITMLSPHLLLENFTAATPSHRCWVPFIDNETTSIDYTEIHNPDALLRISIPLDSNLKPEKCRRFVHPQWHLLHLDGTFLNLSEPDTEPCVDGWVYDQHTFLSTIVTEWDLICGDKTKKSMAQFSFMIGMLTGGFINGHLTDRFGRKLMLRVCLLQFAICGSCVAFAPTFLTYCSLRFLVGCSACTIITNISMLNSEWVRSQLKSMIVAVISSAFGAGYVLLGGLAYVIRDWRTLQLVLSVPYFVFFLISRWMIESARWLIITNKPDKGLKALKKVACINGMKNAEETLNIECVRVTMQQELEEAQKSTTMFDLVRTPVLRKRICILAFARAASILPYYGIVINLQYFGNNIFLFQVLFGIVTTSARFLGYFTLRNTGHRLNQMFLFFLVGIFIFSNSLVPQEMQILRVTLACVALCLISVGFNEYGIHLTELIPTVLRARALGVESLSSRCGASAAPLLMTLEVYHPSLPWAIYSVCPSLAALLIFFLPETRNQPLPDTIEDVEKNRRDSRETKLDNTCTRVTQI